jgi:hypothetical protein
LSKNVFRGTKSDPSFENLAGLWWLTPVILATQKAQIRRIMVHSQPWEKVWETLSPKKPSQKRVGGVSNPRTKKSLITIKCLPSKL